jgi:hypothetical protein
VPRASRAIDFSLELDEPSDGWGPLCPVLAHRQVLVEHFSKAPGIAALAGCLAKHGFVAEQHWSALDKDARARARARAAAAHAARSRQAGPRPYTYPTAIPTKKAPPPSPAPPPPRSAPPPPVRRPDVRRPPVLLILTAGLPRLALSGGLELPASQHPGIWFAERPLYGDIVLVHLRGLPLDAPGCAGLRLFAESRNRQEATAVLEALMNDQSVLQSTKNRLAEVIMHPAFPATPDERGSIVDRLLAEGEKRGKREGKKEGKKEGVAALLAVLRPIVDDEVWQELARIDDLDALKARALEILAHR